jgi:pyruvate dehydrogenase E2 component (dihydrolipoamide acetyltransferase)
MSDTTTPETTRNVALPQLGESVTSGTIVTWLVEIGDEVEIDQPIAEVSTDKVDTEIPSSLAGTVTRFLVEVDQEVEVGEPLLELATAGEGGAPPQSDPLPPQPPETETMPTPTTDSAGAAEAGTRTAEVTRPAATGSRSTGEHGPLSPLVKRLLRERNLDPTQVTGTGTSGRITPDDVREADAGAGTRSGTAGEGRLSPLVRRLLGEHGLEPHDISGTGADRRVTPEDVRAAAAARDAPSAPAPPSAAPRPSTTPRPSAPAAQTLPDGSRVEPLSRTRKIIAERMLTSLQTTAQLTAAVEADVTRLMHARERHKDAYRSRYGHSLSPLALISRAVCRTLLRHPVLNASIDTDAGTVTYHRDVHLGMAIDTPAGLIVATIRDAHQLTAPALQQRIADLASRARDRSLRPDDVGGGTFTVTNTGSAGTLFDTPILNPPEVGILATPTIEKRPVVVQDADGNDQIAIRQRTYLCLSYDHRLVDGADAARFLTDLAEHLDTADWDQELGGTA